MALVLAGLAGCGSGDRTALPVVTVPVAAPDSMPLALLLSGDGDWADFPQLLADSLVRHGMPVVGVKMRKWLEQGQQDAASTAAALDAALRQYLVAWQRSAIVLIGYSRGANLAPFILDDLPPDLRRRIRTAVFVGMADHANFRFHLEDLLKANPHHPGDLPVPPAVEQLRGLRLVCVYGVRENESWCPRAPAGLMQVLQHPGGHLLLGDVAKQTAGIVVRALDPQPAEHP